MSSRKRSLRSIGSRKPRRSLPPLLESLENRMVLSQVSPILRPVTGPISDTGGAPPPTSIPVTPVGAKPTLQTILNTPQVEIRMVPGPNGVLVPDVGTDPSPLQGDTPQQLQNAYGYNAINFGGVKGDGAGQTIAVIDAGNNPGFVPSTSPSFSTSDLAKFDQAFGLPDPVFGMYNQTGGTTLPGEVNANWGVEIALDIEWAHSIAPAAQIDIVEGDGATTADLFTAMDTAVKLGASVVSMSFGADYEFFGYGSLEKQIDQTYFAPALAANPNVTFLASTGDDGADPGDSPLYPSVSPNVIGVGGTTLELSKTGQWESEIGWSYGSDPGQPDIAGGGGISNEYTEPTFQDPYQSTGFRTLPDVASEADPDTGVQVYDSTDFGSSTPFGEVGGTSLASPTWAGLIAIADQGRAATGLAPLGGPTQTLPALYGIPAADYHDETVGFNFYSAGPGYDLVTGRGSPIATKLIPDLVGYGAATKAAIAYEPPSTVDAGGIFGTVVYAEVASGKVAFGFSGTAEISLLSGPSGVTFTSETVTMLNGVGVIDGLSLVNQSSTPYVFQINVDAGKTPFATLQTTGVTVTAPAPQGTGIFYPLPVDVSLRNDIGLAETNADPTNNMLLVYNADYQISQGTIVLQNMSSTLGNKDLQFIGQGEGKSVITADGTSRDFEILGLGFQSANNLTVFFQGLTISGGRATDIGGLVLPTNSGVGGGLLMDGGLVTMSKVSFTGNSAEGQSGATGFLGASVTGGPGGPGGAGGIGQGGAIYLAAGTLTLTDDLITGNVASGGLGGVGGTGGLAGTLTEFGSFYFPHREPGGVGGTGGQGGSGQGGGLFVNGGHVTITSGTVTGNSAKGGTGGVGGLGGTGGTFNFPGGQGGLGGPGGPGAGGGIYLFSGSVTLNSVNLSANGGVGGVGGKGGTGGFGGVELTTAGGIFTGKGGQGGDGGKGGLGNGGGMYILNGSVVFNNTAVSGSDAGGGEGGTGGVVGIGAPGNKGGGEGPGGSGVGGGIFDDAAALTLNGAVINNNTADNGGGVYVKGGLTLENSTISTNKAINGGGIDITGTLVLQDTDLTDNTASGNGGGVTSNGNFTITGGTFSGNISTLLGGAIDSSGKGSITGVEFSSNNALDGGAIFAAKNGTLTITSGTSFDTNTAEEGGAIESQGTLTLAPDVNFSGNQATGGGTGDGGAIYNNQGKATVTGDTFGGNSGTNGGAIESIKGPITVSLSSFTGNQATGIGGAIGGTGAVNISGGNFSDNTANFGGAIGDSGTLTVSAATISGNSASGGSGGGIWERRLALGLRRHRDHRQHGEFRRRHLERGHRRTGRRLDRQ